MRPVKLTDPCPYCGVENALKIDENTGRYRVRCEKCGTRGNEADDPESACRIFDMRPEPDIFDMRARFR